MLYCNGAKFLLTVRRELLCLSQYLLIFPDALRNVAAAPEFIDSSNGYGCITVDVFNESSVTANPSWVSTILLLG